MHYTEGALSRRDLVRDPVGAKWERDLVWGVVRTRSLSSRRDLVRRDLVREGNGDFQPTFSFAANITSLVIFPIFWSRANRSVFRFTFPRTKPGIRFNSSIPSFVQVQS